MSERVAVEESRSELPGALKVRNMFGDTQLAAKALGV